ncbi:MAG TPA: HAD-IA family hydrolase [Tepidisphaeraceae bacterium]|jgi:beta-phosphoglucomutase family hydrolase|nr:HAD-IA family hydrolase [Tepidisphaeraceae bacterium]
MVTIPPHIRGLVFDCDGTIADTMPLHYKAWTAALGAYGHDFPEALFYEMAGIPTVRIMEILNERHGYRLPVQESAELKERLFVEFIPQVLPIEPVVQIVNDYRGKLPMAVATGATRVTCQKTLTALGLIDRFSVLVTADDVQHGKPAPDIFLEAARQIGVQPELCYAFEDADLGIESATAAGMTVIDIRPLRVAKPSP